MGITLSKITIIPLHYNIMSYNTQIPSQFLNQMNEMMAEFCTPEKMQAAQEHFMKQNPEMFRAYQKYGGCQKNKNCENEVNIPLKKFDAKQVNLNMNKQGLITVTASKEEVEETKRNGSRKTTIVVEETVQLPGYLVDNGLLNKVESKFADGFLKVSWPENPAEKATATEKENDGGPVEIPIVMEDVE